ncbi:putative T7SS-secreted protein [Streptomyces sp. MB09-02B]|uniref:putative T7SS-secreted protein n=1 Tax=Streptomyces sp. MB09-02B TaxID=3028667 RepID=UPI0029BBD462|nr:ADP-ribosyltransferase [Streptomyces sp. MB09-02B]MDX3639369.1 ADP-ribosyltransferase [Streptomyces sp. MB09-02B]
MGIVDGIRDGLNAGLKVGEHLVDEGSKKLGEGVDYATDKVGDGLDYVGLHGAADAVEDFGDELAADLGAMPGEQQLGESEEADELIHGNPAKIRESAKHLKDFQAAFDKVGTGMKKVDSSTWKGESGNAFREKFSVHPTKWLHAADACETAAGALDAYAETVKWAQTQAQEAIALYKQGKKASVAAVETYNKKVDAYNAKIRADQDPGPQPEPFHDPGIADMRAARDKLAQARKQRNSVASETQTKVRAALAHAPAEPPPLDRLGNNLVDGAQAYYTELTHVVGGALKGTAGLVNFVRGLNPLDPYNVTHPAAYIENVNMTLSGLVSTAAHPERVAQAVVDGFQKDRSEFIGRLLPELLGTKGAGLARTGIRVGVKEGLEAGASNLTSQGVRLADDLAPTGRALHADSMDAAAAQKFLDENYPGIRDLNGGTPDNGFQHSPHVPDDVWNGLTHAQRHEVAAAELSDGAVSFRDPDSAVSYGRDHWNNYVDDLPDSAKDALRDYSKEPPIPGAPGSATYKEMNGFLRGKEEWGTPEVLRNIEEVDRALAGKPIPEDVMVVRGTGIRHVEFEDVKDLVGREITDPGYTSSSLGNHPVPSFEGKEAILRLRVPEGTHGTWIENVSDFGVTERELLLGRGMSYKVTRAFEDENGQYQIYGHVLPSN